MLQNSVPGAVRGLSESRPLPCDSGCEGLFSPPRASVSLQSGFPVGFEQGLCSGAWHRAGLAEGGPEATWVPAAPTQPIPLAWGHCSSGGFCGYPEQVITMENGTGAESKLLLELGRFWGPRRVTGTERSPVPCPLCPLPCPLCPLLCPLCPLPCPLCPAPCRAVPFED